MYPVKREECTPGVIKHLEEKLDVSFQLSEKRITEIKEVQTSNKLETTLDSRMIDYVNKNFSEDRKQVLPVVAYHLKISEKSDGYSSNMFTCEDTDVHHAVLLLYVANALDNGDKFIAQVFLGPLLEDEKSLHHIHALRLKDILDGTSVKKESLESPFQKKKGGSGCVLI